MSSEPILPLGPPIPDDRPLTAEERRLARWMLEHGGPDAAPFLAQLECARVVSRCACGCATIDLEVEGLQPGPDPAMRPLADFMFEDGGDTSLVFIYAYGGVLSGIEVTGLSGDTPKVLPTPEMLQPMDS